MDKEMLLNSFKNSGATVAEIYKGGGGEQRILPKSFVINMVEKLDEPEITESQAWETLAPRFSMSATELQRQVLDGFLAMTAEEIELESDKIKKLADGIKKLHAENEELKAKIDEPEVVVIPQFVADWIDAHDLHVNNPLREYRDLEIDFNEGWTDEKDAAVYHWVNKNPYAFIDALRYGYKVEKEKLYQVIIPTKDTVWKYYYLDHDGGIDMESNLKYVHLHTEAGRVI